MFQQLQSSPLQEVFFLRVCKRDVDTGDIQPNCTIQTLPQFFSFSNVFPVNIMISSDNLNVVCVWEVWG